MASSASQQAAMGGDKWAPELDAIEAELQRVKGSNSDDPHEALVALVARVRALPETAPLERRAAVLIDIAGQYYLRGGKQRHAVEPAALAVLLAERSSDATLLRRALSVQGLILGDMHSTSDALRSLLRALALAEELSDPVGLGNAWLNIGVTLYEAALNAEARDCFARAVGAADRLQSPKEQRYVKTRALHGIGVCSLALHDYKQAVTASQSAADLTLPVKTKEDALQRSLAEGIVAHALIGLNRSDEAEAHAAIALEMAVSSGSDRPAVLAEMASALVAVHRGQYDDGLRRLLESRKQLFQSGAPNSGLLIGLRSTVAAHEKVGNYAAALETYREFVDMTKQARLLSLGVQKEIAIARLNESAALVGVATPPGVLFDSEVLTRLSERVRWLLAGSQLDPGYSPPRKPFRWL